MRGPERLPRAGQYRVHDRVDEGVVGAAKLQVAGDGHQLSQTLLFADGVDAARFGVSDGERRHREPGCVLRTEPELGSGERRVSGVVHQRTHEIGVAALGEVGSRTGVQHVQACQGRQAVQRVEAVLPTFVTGIDDPDRSQ